MTSLRLWAFGVPRLERNGLALSLPRRKSTALLVYLAVTSQPHSRDTLATLFWPERDPARARANLRREISVIKEVLGDGVLLLDRDQIRLHPGLDLWLDTGEFQSRLEEVRRHALIGHSQAESPVCAACLASLNEAAALYTGDFMAGHSLPDSAAFDEWQFFQMESFRRLLAEALQQLIQWHSAQEEFETGIAYARRWLALDPLHEPAHRWLMQLYAWSGQATAALRQYQECARLLGEELEVEPEDETTALFHAIRLRQLSSPGMSVEKSSPPQPPTSPAGPPPQPTLHLSRPDFEQEIHFCRSRDGVRLAYATTGEGPPFVKVANWLSHLDFDWNSPVWRHWIEHFSQDHTFVRYDERGCGLSDWIVDEFSLDAFVCDLEAVVDALDLERFPLLGVSHGGAVAIAYAVRHPEKVSHMIIYGSYGGKRKGERSPRTLGRLHTMLDLIKIGWGQENPAFRQVYTTLFIPEGTPEQVSWFNDLQRISTAPEIAARLQESFYNLYVRDLAPQVTAPTIVLHAREDAVVPFEEGRQLAALIPGARFIPLESKNHLLLAEEPAWYRFLSEVGRFLGD